MKVSDTTLVYDKTVKLSLYAGVGLPESWIVAVQGRKVEVHTNPGPGGYLSVREVGSGEQYGPRPSRTFRCR